jgi:hypothetical protein
LAEKCRTHDLRDLIGPAESRTRSELVRVAHLHTSRRGSVGVALSKSDFVGGGN